MQESSNLSLLGSDSDSGYQNEVDSPHFEEIYSEDSNEGSDSSSSSEDVYPKRLGESVPLIQVGNEGEDSQELMAYIYELESFQSLSSDLAIENQ